MLEKVKQSKSKIIIFLFVIATFVFSLPSIIYLVQNKTIYRFVWVWTYLFKRPIEQSDKILNAILFFAIFSALFLIYFLIIKHHKNILKTKKQLLILIAVVSVLFLCIIPYTSTDVYSYIANGWSVAHYKANPYYVATGEIADYYQVNDPMFNKVANCWRYETVVYGPLWTMICSALSGLSFGNIDIALLLFKLTNLIIHLINCLLIHKITKKNLFVVLYGLNPFILFEALGNVHNDIFIVFFILLALYFAIKKKNLFVSVAFIAMATAIKYLAILILPFIVLYLLKDKEVKDRIKCCIYCGIEYIAIIAFFYIFFLNDLQVLSGIFIQQGKYNRSIFYLIYDFLNADTSKVAIIQNITLGIFAIYYIFVVIKLLLQKEMKLYKTIGQYHIILMIFTFVLITNFNPWYMMWLFPTMFWLKGKSIKNILHLSYAGQIANLLSFALWSEEQYLSLPYFMIMVATTLVLNLITNKTNWKPTKYLKRLEKIKKEEIEEKN